MTSTLVIFQNKMKTLAGNSFQHLAEKLRRKFGTDLNIYVSKRKKHVHIVFITPLISMETRDKIFRFILCKWRRARDKCGCILLFISFSKTDPK